AWAPIKAVEGKRVHLSPKLPFGWVDFPPSVNRLIGLWWLAKILYPERFPEDLRMLTRDFYRRFYHVTIDDKQLDRVLAGRGCGRVPRSAIPGLAIALAVVAAGLIVAFTLGRYPVSLGELIDVLWSRAIGRASSAPAAVENVVLLVRGPRVIAAVIVGAALAV